MDKKRWQKVKDIFDEVSELPPEKRELALQKHCGDDRELYQEVTRLLIADDQPHSLFQHSASEHMEKFTDADIIGTKIGAWEIVKRLASGGMGIVYLARRADGQFAQNVALKIIKRGMDSEEILSRFKSERQILAQLEHPNIARLIDGGMANTGQLYFCMEYIDGVTITKYCDFNKLSIKDRLEMFSQVCEAVQYAHQNLVVHRDLKPGNILVDKKGNVKLVDFGIAKLLGQEANAEAVPELTRTGLRVMTPAFASPEQAAGKAITTASDVYSLGVLLYVLLTGQNPNYIDGAISKAKEKIFNSSEPLKPSLIITRHSTETGISASTQNEIYQSRQTDSIRLKRILKGDIDNICMMALRNEPSRRYSSAGQLHEDISRYQRSLPVIARADTVTYRTSRFVRRNLFTVVASGIVTIIFTTLMAYYTIQLAEERDRAMLEAAKAQQVAEFILEMFSSANPNVDKGTDITAKDLLESGSKRINTELADQPEVQATMMKVIGDVYISLGMQREALLHLNQSAQIRKQLFGEKHIDVAESYRYLGLVWYDLEQYDSSIINYKHALAIDRDILNEDDRALATDINDLASAYRRKGDFTESEKLFREALKLRRQYLPPNDLDLAHTLNQLGRLLSMQERFDEAMPLLKEGLEIRKSNLGDDHFEVVASRGSLANVMRLNHDLEGAEKLTRISLRTLKKLVGDDHNYTGAVTHSLATILLAKKQFQKADSLFLEASEILKRTLPEGHVKNARPLIGRGTLYMETGRLKEAKICFEQAVELRRINITSEHWLTALAESYLGECLCRLKQYPQAERELLHSIKLLLKQYDINHRYVDTTRKRLIYLYNQWGKPEKADKFLKADTVSF